ncbi:retrovirus-related pol polyprotein from transposon TNT 1-94 [Tanacetum coccineum]
MAKIQEVPTADSGTDTEPLEQVQYYVEYNVFANERQHSEKPESIRNTCVVEKVDSNVILDSPDMCDNDIQTDQNVKDECVALANLIANLTLDTEENKKILKQLKKANATLTQELKECKSNLEESNTTRDICLIALQSKQTELEKYMTLNDRTVDYDKLELVKEKHDELVKQSLLTKSHYEGLVKEKTKVITDLKLNEEKDIDKMISMRKQLKELVDQAWEKYSHDHFRAPTAHDMEILIKTCLMPLALKTQNDSFKFFHELKQEMHADSKYVESLEKEIDELKYDKSDYSNMYDLLLQECVSNDVMCSYLHSLSDIDAHTELQCLCLHKVKECDCLAQKLSKQTETILPQTARQAVRNTNVIKPCMYQTDTRTTQTRAPQLPQTSRNTDPPVSTSTRVIQETNVSRPPLRSTQMKDMVMPNNSQVKFKKTEVEDHHRISNNSNKTKSIVQLIIFIVDSGCTKHMTGYLKLLCNFVKKYIGTVRFSNDQFALILGYEDLVQRNITINRGNDLLTGNRRSDFYKISLHETTSSTPICFMAKASPTQAWLWHRRLSHLNFDYINLLLKKDIMIGLLKLKYVKDQLCSSCEVSKAKRSSFKTKAIPSSKGRLNLLHMDLYVPMRVASINGKKYILVIVDDYFRYTLCHTPPAAETRKCNIMINHNTRYIIEKTKMH